MTAIEIINHAQVAVPTIVRLIAQPLVKEILTHCYHKAVHHVAAHTVAHRLHFVGHFLKKYPIAIDAVVILAMLAFGAVTEGHEGGEAHEGGSESDAVSE
jgi:hypothetical protein